MYGVGISTKLWVGNVPWPLKIAVVAFFTPNSLAKIVLLTIITVGDTHLTPITRNNSGLQLVIFNAFASLNGNLANFDVRERKYTVTKSRTSH